MSTWFLLMFVYRKAFAKMDLDGNGTIDADELGLVLKSFGEAVPPGRLKALIREVQNVLLVCKQEHSSLGVFCARDIRLGDPRHCFLSNSSNY